MHGPDRDRFLIHASVAVHDPAGRVLLVREAKPVNRGRWNLPGGHVDHGETPAAAARREAAEETGLDLPLAGLVGVYTGAQSVRFVFRAEAGAAATPRAGDEILDVRWATWAEVAAYADDEVVEPAMLRAVGRQCETGSPGAITLTADLIYPRQPAVGEMGHL